MEDQAARQPTKAEVLGAERAVNERYRRLLEEMVDRSPRLAKSVGASDSARWTGTSPKTGVSRSVVSPVVGRVGLHKEDDMLGKSFYIGGLWGREWQENGKDLYVVAWAAPMAKAFYDPDNCATLSASAVGGSRTFEISDGDVRDYEDDLKRGVVHAADIFPLPSAGAVAVPEAPRPVVRPQRSIRPSTSPTAPAAPPAATDPPAVSPSVSRNSSSPPATALPAVSEPLQPASAEDAKRIDSRAAATEDVPLSSPTPLRAEKSVRKAIEAPRTGRLGAVLSTLQPDQYELVQWPHDRSLVIQGQPGTGKTIIATHRAAYLVHPDNETNVKPEVGLVGPTEAWAHHVDPSVSQLGVNGVRVMSMPALLGAHAGVKASAMVPGREGQLDASWELANFFEAAVPILRRKSTGPLTTRGAVKMLTGLDPSLDAVLEQFAEVQNWLREAKNWEVMSGHRRYLPALAFIGELLGVGPNGKLNHLVVDEAQDVRPMEWRVVTKRLATGAGITVVGDLNQRRSDWTYPSWEALAQELDIIDSEGRIAVKEITTGYRSTRRILKFANQLLPKHQRSIGALREGTDPVVRKVPADQMIEAAYRAAGDLASLHPTGQVAIIAMAPRQISDRFRKRSWTRPAEFRHAWRSDEMTVVVLHPEEARGLEFDGVVVVEPSEFPENVGRIGSLYTSLTRATKDLTVLHTKPLPRDLRLPRG